MNRPWEFKLNILEAEVLTDLWQITSGTHHFSSLCYRLNQKRISGVSQTLWQIWGDDFQADIRFPGRHPQSHILMYNYKDIKAEAYRLHGGGVLKLGA